MRDAKHIITSSRHKSQQSVTSRTFANLVATREKEFKKK